MTEVSALQAYDDIDAYIKKQGGSYRDWYVGISSDAIKRLFTDHQVPEKDSWWIYRSCTDEKSARMVEEALIKLGCDGGSSGGDSSATQVYAYLKTGHTKP